ncbi:MAG: Ppx/GppA phosphatase family protein [Actinomycetota bacterium]|nr:Ppx/GppA phosphatase family protein [Actinomycetota bacterium]
MSTDPDAEIDAAADTGRGVAPDDDAANGQAADTFAAVDIGTNSMHLLVARVLPSRRFEVLASEKEMVRLGSGAGDMKTLTPDAIDRGIDCLSRFRQIAEISGAQIKAVATSAVREADNQAEFLRRARAEAGVDVEVISGTEEARLIHLGVLQAVAVYDRRLLLIDIGGGSTELLIGRGGETEWVRSLKLGAIRLSERFFTDGRSSPKRIERCRQHVRAFLAPLRTEVRSRAPEVCVGSSGTIGALATMIGHLRGDPPKGSVNHFTFTRAELDKITQVLGDAQTPKERLRVAGLEAKRADIIVGGAVLLDVILDELGMESLTVSDFALREGIILDQLQEYHGDSLHHLSDLRRGSVEHVAELFDADRAHSDHSTNLALRLFAATADLHGLGPEVVDYLEAAGLLSNVGRFISHSAHHKHSYYLIRNTDQLTGFTDHEIELIALVARYHRKSAPKLKHDEFAALDDTDRHLVRVLAGLLRVGIGLDRAHAGNVVGLDCAVEPPAEDGGRRRLIITVTVAAGADASLDIYAAAERRSLLEDALDADIELTTTTGAGR